jgi:NADPH-dependent glutamate synthase beta subunit-like oxidoreductase
MPTVTIDGRDVDVPEGTTVLEAARRLSIEIPTLCYLAEFGADPSCFVCAVQVEGRGELSPSCALPAEDGMVVETSTDDVLAARRAALELMLSDHTGDCVAPCTLACPAHLDVADFIYEITRSDPGRALRVIKRKIALPASLGRICPRFCERVCRRSDLDEPVAVCSLRRFAADLDLESAEPFVPQVGPSSGKSVAIVGAGPAGLSAAYYLLERGHGCTVLDAREEPGGMFRYGIADWRLPNEILDAEIDCIRRMGAAMRMETRLGDDVSLDELRRQFDAVVLAIGAQTQAGAAETFTPQGHTASGGEPDLAFVKGLGFDVGPRGVKVDRHSQATSLPGVFAAGNVTSGPNYGVHAVAAGRRAALAVDRTLRGQTAAGERRAVHVLMRDLTEAEKERLFAGADPSRRVLLPGEADGRAERGLTEAEALAEARRCLDCDCGKRDDCLLRRHAEAAGAAPGRFRGQRRPFERDRTHPDIVYESGKCIQCGRCVRIAEREREALGLTFIGRGFTVRTAAPFSETLGAGLQRVARRCAEVCPTGAIALRRELRRRD